MAHMKPLGRPTINFRENKKEKKAVSEAYTLLTYLRAPLDRIFCEKAAGMLFMKLIIFNFLMLLRSWGGEAG